ncbi:MAG: hypothetical protein DDT39_01709 [Firmicutes bacterium]|nr:hypothetical protein [candidate division NPL-UPA2 bacterium]
MQTKAKAKAKAATPAPPATLSPRAQAIAAHDAAGFTGSFYAGLSKPRNSGVTKAPNLSTSKATPRTFAQLTERMHKCLAELAAKHGAKAFPLIGIDRGQAAIFLASGFIARDGESNVKLSTECLKRYTAKPKA